MSEPAILVEDLTKSFGRVEALRGIDLSVDPGTIYGLLGPNGAGKTTAVRILTTIIKPDSGRASVLGIDVGSHPQTVREQIGLAGQFAAVDENLTGRENLWLTGRLTHMPKAEARRAADELIDRFGLSDAADRMAKTYSGGMRRRLDVAAALVHKPPVLFLDEPTTGLDPASRKDVWELIDELVGGGTTVLLTTQYLEEADRLAERVAVVDHGKVIAEGSPAQLKADMGATVIDLTFSGPEAAVRAEEVLRSSGTLAKTGAHPRVEESTLELPVDDGPAAVVDVLRALDAEGASPSTLAVREPSLDDVFLTLTGHRAEGSGEDGASGEAAAAAGGRLGRAGRRGRRGDAGSPKRGGGS